MKSSLILAVLCLLNTLAFSQINEVVDKSIVIYANTLYSSAKSEAPLGNNTLESTEQTLHFGTPSFALRTTRSNGWSREFEVNNISLFRIDDNSDIIIRDTLNQTQIQLVEGQRQITSSLGLRHEWIRLCHTSKSEKLRLYVGAGVGAGFSYMLLEPKISTSFRQSMTNVSLSSQIVPRMTYDFSSRVRLDINVVANWLSSSMVSTTTDNPLITDEERKTTTQNIDILAPQAHLRIGLAFDICKAE